MTLFIDSILDTCRNSPDRQRLTFLSGDSTETVDGKTLLKQVLQLSAGLRTVAKPGDRVLLAYPAGNDFITGFLGSLHAGLVPVPVTYPKPRRPLSRYATVADNCDATLALTSSSMLSVVDPATLAGVRWHSHETLHQQSQAADDQPDLTSIPRSDDDLLFLQYTSGSTSQPKGVCVTTENVRANLRSIRKGFGIDRLTQEQRVVCSWLPAYHDMGLVGVILSSLIHDGLSVLMSPTAFVQQPLQWIKAISDYRASVTVAPCFGYQWAASKISQQEIEDHCIDLSCLGLAACGAEPIAWPDLKRFADHFAGAGFRSQSYYPCYGLAESTLMVTGADRGDGQTLPGPVVRNISRRMLAEGKVLTDGATEPNQTSKTDDESNAALGDDFLTIVSCGVSDPDTSVQIVDPATHRTLPENAIGEIRVQSPSIAMGYWNDPGQTEATFQGNVVGQDGPFLCTGDLGFINDSELYVTGRIKDLIIMGGQNHYPQDIEKTVSQADPVLASGGGAAFSVPRTQSNDQSAPNSILEMGERLVLLQELPRGFDSSKTESLVQSIRLAIASVHELTIEDIVLVRPASLSRTSSGKIQRSLCRKRFLDNEFKPIFHWQSSQELDRRIFPDLSAVIKGAGAENRVRQKIQNAMLQWLSQNLETADGGMLRPDESFAQMGVDSLKAVELSEQLQRWLNVPLSPVAAWSYPTPQAMAKFLTDKKLSLHQRSADADASQADEEDSTDMASIDPGSETDFATLLAQIESLDEAEVQAMLGKR